MAYTGLSRESNDRPWNFTLCLNAEECKLLLPVMEKRLKEAEKKYEKYYDIHQGGEATGKQENLLLKFEEERDTLDCVLHHAKSLLGMDNK